MILSDSNSNIQINMPCIKLYTIIDNHMIWNSGIKCVDVQDLKESMYWVEPPRLNREQIISFELSAVIK